ncbi:hypothetical protein JRO89_XS02G0281100 [Xanthoceras sorbifolium]|uniref:Disease resistance RPP13-like protein 1 n=1 Tax=Xanthoceras sorbifolium TaxID=99658 RepID=A0ABQ8IHH7_9ROSI|nr:hypothetical protein JRO89_XS02G0281100 [Xanthoceras sorbifolium]
MSIIGEAVLTVSLDLLLNKLASSELLSFASREQILADLKKWENKLRIIYAVLEDAEEKQITNRFVKSWLVDLQNLAYDVEDILDEFETVAMERKLSHQPTEASTSKVRKLIPTCFTNFNPRSLKFNKTMGSEIKEITERLEQLLAEKNELRLLESPKERPNKVNRSDQRLPTTSLSEAHVYGREQDQEAIIELLLKDDGKEDGISVIPIVGIGGVGKTTLAQNVYSDARVTSHFDLKAWACVSDDFDVIRVTKAILQLIFSADDDRSDLNKLQVELEGKLLKKKFLIVLDDIWNENYNLWTGLLRPFRAGSSGSKIIITTRSDYISSMVGTVPTHRLKELSYDDCLSIYTYHSLGRKDFDGHPNLKEVGKKIVNKCNGLPLAAKSLGGLLRNNVNRDDWEHVLNSNIWDLPQERSDIIPALKLSYHYLPPHLKRCFAYCSLLPKDYEFQKEEIILLWMAQGFLQQESSAIHMEQLGDEYFRDLQSRSFFQQSSNNTSRYVMHDLINDLAQLVAGEIFFFRMEHTLDRDKQNYISKSLRHLSYVGGDCDGIKMFEAFYGVNDFSNTRLHNKVEVIEPFSEYKCIRTFLPLVLSSSSESRWLTRDILNVLPKLRRLRVLSLNGYMINELSIAIGNLKHLRHIDLSGTTIFHLPDSISSLYNLLTLKLEGCPHLKKLCDVENLINLRYLNTSRTQLHEMPLNIGKLTSLRMLSDFVVSYSTGPGLKALKLLKHLQGTLRISGLENINDAVDAKEADLTCKKDLRVLLLKWINSDVRNEEMETQVLDMLRPNQKLEQLTINGFRGLSLPVWLGDTSFSNLVLVRITDCCSISLPSVGQLPSLKDLVIRGMCGIKRVGTELYGNGCSRPFASLETLYFEDMREWEEWISHGIGQEVEAFPHLQQLSIVDCPKLQGRLPEHLPSLKRLVIQRCGELLVSVASFPVGCRFELYGCKQVQPRTDINLGSLNPMIFADFQGNVFLIQRFMQRLSEDRVQIVGYEARMSFWHSEMVALQDAKELCASLNDRLFCLLKEKEEELQLLGFPCICQYLVLDSVCLTKLPQVLHNLDFLRRICISNCSELVSFPEATLPSQLTAIYIESCNALECLPDTWMDSTSLECLSVSRCQSLVFLARNQLSQNLKDLVIKYCNNLKTLMREENNTLQSSIFGTELCPSTTSSFSKSELPATLERIQIEDCEDLKLLPEDLQKLNHLDWISIIGCPSLVSFPAGGLPSMNLTNLQIKHCGKLEALPHNMHQLNHLQHVTIEDCSSLVSFPTGGLPCANLTYLEIRSCEKLEDLPDNMHQLNYLQNIKIWYCSSLVVFPAGGFPSTNLKELKIRDCEKLEALPNGMHQLNHLQRIEISNCSSLVSFPDEGLPSTNLTELRIWGCEKLKGLPNCMHNLTSLRELRILNCRGMETFPENGFPINLTSLAIVDTPKICEPLFQWGLHKLSSLTYLYIEGCLVSFPAEERGIILPTSLTILTIREFPNLVGLSSVIQSLNSLEELNLENCPKLKSFPKKGLPLSLLRLRIYGCPLLKQNYKEHGGRYWPMIAYIPDIDID